LVTNAGDSIYNIAAMWLVHDLTGSTLYTGIAGALFLLPQALQFLTGPLVDDNPVREILVVTQFIQAVGVLLVPILAYTGHLSVWVVIGLIPLLGFLNQFVYPAQNAALPRIVEDEDLVHANSLFRLSHQGANLVFNAAGGALIAVAGAAVAYLINSVTFLLALLLFVGVVVPTRGEDTDTEQADTEDEVPADATEATAESDDSNEEEDPSVEQGYVGNLKQGFGYLRGSVIVPMLVIGAIPNLGFGLMTAVLPALADSLGGAGAYGVLAAAFGGGNLAGSAVASRLEDIQFGVLTIAGATTTAVCLLLGVYVGGLFPTAALFFLAFVPIGARNVVFWSILQSGVDDSMLGRVTSVASSSSTLLMPLGSLLGGIAASYVGPGTVIVLMAASMLFTGVAYLLSPRLRILPAAAQMDEELLDLA
jgi:MFS family permease